MRLIDADKLCEDLLNRWSIADTRKEELIRQIMADIVTPIVVSQPTINNWIPCSERLPKYGEAVLTVNEDEDYEINHVIDEDNGEWFFDDAIAWMPLPEPYKEK